MMQTISFDKKQKSLKIGASMVDKLDQRRLNFWASPWPSPSQDIIIGDSLRAYVANLPKAKFCCTQTSPP
jgi:hypothetical protein